MRQIFEFAGSVPVRHLYPAATEPLRNAGVLRFAIKPIVLSDSHEPSSVLGRSGNVLPICTTRWLCSTHGAVGVNVAIWPHPHRGGSAAVPCGDGFGLRVGVVTRLDRAGAIAAPNKPAWAVGVVVQRCGATAKRTR